MTKILLSVFVCLSFSFSAMACKPAPLTRNECSKPNVRLDYKKYISLLKDMVHYQKTLTRGIIYPQGAHSCFDNKFANYYGLELKRFMDEHKRLACREQIEVVKSSFKRLIGDSEEFRAVKSSAIQEDLRKQAGILYPLIEEVLK